MRTPDPLNARIGLEAVVVEVVVQRTSTIERYGHHEFVLLVDRSDVGVWMRTGYARFMGVAAWPCDWEPPRK